MYFYIKGKKHVWVNSLCNFLDQSGFSMSTTQALIMQRDSTLVILILHITCFIFSHATIGRPRGVSISSENQCYCYDKKKGGGWWIKALWVWIKRYRTKWPNPQVRFIKKIGRGGGIYILNETSACAQILIYSSITRTVTAKC